MRCCPEASENAETPPPASFLGLMWEPLLAEEAENNGGPPENFYRESENFTVAHPAKPDRSMAGGFPKVYITYIYKSTVKR